MKKYETITLILDTEKHGLIVNSSMSSVCTAKFLLRSGLECASKIHDGYVFDGVITDHITNLHKLVMKKCPVKNKKSEVYTPNITVEFKTN